MRRRSWITSLLKSPAWTGSLFVVSVFVAGGIAGKVLDHVLATIDTVLPAPSLLIYCLIGVALVMAVWVTLHYQVPRLRRLLRSEARELAQEDLSPRRHLITGHSKITKDEAKVAELIRSLKPADVPARCAESGGILAGWQQSLRMVHFLRNELTDPNDPNQRNRLNTVFVIDSGANFVVEPAKGRSPQVALFATMLRNAFPDLTVRVVPEGAEVSAKELRIDRITKMAPDYERYGYVNAAFDLCFRLLAADKTAKQSDSTVEPEADCYIDVTPGQKIFSVAAAIQTLNRGAIFLYATSFTNKKDETKRPGGYDIFGYDAQVHFDLGGK